MAHPWKSDNWAEFIGLVTLQGYQDGYYMAQLIFFLHTTANIGGGFNTTYLSELCIWWDLTYENMDVFDTISIIILKMHLSDSVEPSRENTHFCERTGFR